MVATLAASGEVSITGQLLAYQDGFVFFTSGAGFRVAPDIKILDYVTQKPATRAPGPRAYAKAVFDAAGSVTELDLSQAPLPLEPLPDDVAKFAVAASTPYPNPELAQSGPAVAEGEGSSTGSGRPVLVVVTVEVPPLTPPSARIYMTTDTSGWNPQAIPMDRIDALHYRIMRRIAAGSIFHYLYTRGSLQTEERAENGLLRDARKLVVTDADVRAVNDTVFSWTDALTGGQSGQPNAIPTPYNPAPFPNLPAGFPTPHP
jgi:hypothetical protein